MAGLVIGDTLGNLGMGGPTTLGDVLGVTATQAGALASIHATWDFNGIDNDQNVVFLVYVDGRLARRLSGTSRAVDVLTTGYGTRTLEVVVWPAWFSVPQESYGQAASSRAHLEWTRLADATVAGYKVYHATTEGGAYSLMATLTTTELSPAVVVMASGAVCTISGVYPGDDHTNTLFTVTVSGSDLVVTNDSDATTLTVPFVVNQPATLFAGVVATVTGSPADADAATFLIGVPPRYDSDPLDSGTHWFKVIATDEAGNPADPAPALAAATAVSVTVTPPPEPVASFSVDYDENTDEITCSGTQGGSADAANVYVYANYDPDTDTVLDAVTFDSPLVTFVAAADAAFSGTLLDASGRPAGTYQFIARAVSSSSVGDGTAEVEEIVLPYVPAALVTPASLAAESLAGGSVRLTWLASDLPDAWQIAVTGGGTSYATPTATSATDGSLFSFSTDVAFAEFGSVDGDYTVTLRATNTAHTRFGTAATVTATADSTAPAALSGLTGIGF